MNVVPTHASSRAMPAPPPQAEEEVGGAQVSRAFQYTRWVNGSTHLWIGRRKHPRRSQGSSGLSFDIIET